MNEAPERIYDPTDWITIGGVDQQSAQNAWDKLNENPDTLDQAFRNPEYIFYCIRDPEKNILLNFGIDLPNFEIEILPSNSDLDTPEDVLFNFKLISRDDGQYDVVQNNPNRIHLGKILSSEEINYFLKILAESESFNPNDPSPEAEEIIKKTRENLN